MTTTTITGSTPTVPFPTMTKAGNQHRRAMIGTMTDTTMLLVWIDHLADGHSTTRMRSARGVASRPLPIR